jgi:uncharacterized membrane protein YbhN (UPF0104 family)
MSSQWKVILKRSWPTIRIVLSIALLWKATSGIDWKALFESELQLQAQWLVAGGLCITAAFICGGLRWGLFMQRAGFQGSLLGYVALYFSGGLINQGLPSTLGGELSHADDLKQQNPKLRLGFSMTLLDRVVGLMGNNILGGIGLVIGGATLGTWGTELGYLILLVMLGAGCVLAFALSYKPLLIWIEKLLARFDLHHALPGIRLAFAWPTNIAQGIFAVSIHCFNILALGFCLKAYGAEVPTEALMIGLPALSLLLMLPISISGWGLREATLASVLALWGVNPSLTVLGSISYGAITLLCVLPGAYKLLKRS